MTRPAALGFDIGTTSVKAGLLWLDGDAPMQVVSHAYPTSRPRSGWVEQDPADWLTAMAACWEELGRLLGRVELRSIGVCSQVNSHVFTDADLVPLRPAITWQDTRAAREAAALDESVEGRRDAIWGGPFTIDASFSLARLQWVADHEPNVRDATRSMLLPKEYCVAALTGELEGDPLSQVGLVGPDGAYLDAVVDLVEGAAVVLPPLQGFDTAAGRTLASNPVGLPADIPVATSTMDAWASFIGAGLLEPGRGVDVAGTSEIVGVSSLRSIPTPGVVSFAEVMGTHVQAGPTQAGGSALQWVADLMGVSLEGALALAAEARKEPQPIVFLPHLAGERAPYWNPDARGVFVGMTSATESRHLVLAVLEGVGYAVRMLTELCETAAGERVEAVRVCGGGARSELWNAIKATILGRPLDVLETLDAGVLGAALLGMAAADLGDLSDMTDRYPRLAARVEPEAAGLTRAEDLYAVYAEAYRALEPIFPRLATD